MELFAPAFGPQGTGSPREGPRTDFICSGNPFAMKYTAQLGPYLKNLWQAHNVAKTPPSHTMQLQPQKQ